ncbi:PaaI family thioesterase [Thioalkalivibrio sp. HK1]|uniref:PaaI family thioesterase n=1 Tax=Thioalkalivibrio sp. HK1 TaxID=1469245 RepID=UPI0012DCE8CD|nr:PaaI family thioesterase [Thioalkalivibrio sp. HK1]
MRQERNEGGDIGIGDPRISDPCARYEGRIEFTIVLVDDRRAIAQMPVQPGILNPFGTVHAGATLWFADVTATHLVLEGRNPSQGMKGFPLAISLNAHLIGNRTEGSFHAEAVYIRRGRRVSVVRTRIKGDDGGLIAEITTSHIQAT